MEIERFAQQIGRHGCWLPFDMRTTNGTVHDFRSAESGGLYDVDISASLDGLRGSDWAQTPLIQRIVRGRCAAQQNFLSMSELTRTPPQSAGSLCCAFRYSPRSGLLVNERGCVTSAALRDQAQLHDRCLYCLCLYYLRRLWPQSLPHSSAANGARLRKQKDDIE